MWSNCWCRSTSKAISSAALPEFRSVAHTTSSPSTASCQPVRCGHRVVSFDLVLAISKDHAVAVLYGDATPSTSRNAKHHLAGHNRNSTVLAGLLARLRPMELNAALVWAGS